MRNLTLFGHWILCCALLPAMSMAATDTAQQQTQHKQQQKARKSDSEGGRGDDDRDNNGSEQWSSTKTNNALCLFSHLSEPAPMTDAWSKNKGWFSNNGSCALFESAQQHIHTINAHCHRQFEPKKLQKTVREQQMIEATHELSRPF